MYQGWRIYSSDRTVFCLCLLSLVFIFCLEGRFPSPISYDFSEGREVAENESREAMDLVVFLREKTELSLVSLEDSVRFVVMIDCVSTFKFF